MSIYNALVDERPLGEIIAEVPEMPNLFCAPATIDLAGAEIELVPMVAREGRLSRSIEQLDTSKFDYVLIDCPPSLGLLTVNALVAAEEVLIPIQCEYYALEGLEQLLRTVELVRAHLNSKLKITTILLTMYDGRTRLATQVADDVREHFNDVVLHTIIPRSVRVSEAPSLRPVRHHLRSFFVRRGRLRRGSPRARLPGCNCLSIVAGRRSPGSLGCAVVLPALSAPPMKTSGVGRTRGGAPLAAPAPAVPWGQRSKARFRRLLFWLDADGLAGASCRVRLRAALVGRPAAGAGTGADRVMRRVLRSRAAAPSGHPHPARTCRPRQPDGCRRGDVDRAVGAREHRGYVEAQSLSTGASRYSATCRPRHDTSTTRRSRSLVLSRPTG